MNKEARAPTAVPVKLWWEPSTDTYHAKLYVQAVDGEEAIVTAESVELGLHRDDDFWDIWFRLKPEGQIFGIVVSRSLRPDLFQARGRS
jgi:hypothetical protein